MMTNQHIGGLSPDMKPMLSKDNEKILRYAQEKFHKEGFYKTSMDEIAKDLQISKKTIYKYYPSKEKLVEHVVTDGLTCDSTDIDAIVNSDENVVIKFVKITNLNCQRIGRFSEKYFRDLQVHTPHVWQLVDEFRIKKIRQTLVKLIEQGKEDKLVENYPVEIIITAMVATIRTVMTAEFTSTTNLTLQEAFRHTIDMLMNGMLTEKGKKIFDKERKLLSSNTEKINVSQN